MQLQRHRNWVWKCLPRTQLGSCFPSTHSTGPFKSDPCADWAALISASYSSSVTSVSYPQQLFVSVHLMHNFRLQLNRTRTKRVTSVASVAMATLFFPTLPFSASIQPELNYRTCSLQKRNEKTTTNEKKLKWLLALSFPYAQRSLRGYRSGFGFYEDCSYIARFKLGIREAYKDTSGGGRLKSLLKLGRLFFCILHELIKNNIYFIYLS